MEKVIYNLVFNRKKQLNAEGKALIQVEAYLNRQKRYFSTKVYVKFWKIFITTLLASSSEDKVKMR